MRNGWRSEGTRRMFSDGLSRMIVSTPTNIASHSLRN